MKRSRGRGLLIRLLAVLSAAVALFGAGDYEYELTLSKSRVWLKEPILLTFSIRQTDPSKVMFFDFRPLEKGRWLVRRLDKKVDDTYHRRRAVFTYLLFPLESGTLPLDFDLLVKRTNDETIALSTTGGRDNVRDVETRDTHEPVPPRVVEVRPLPGKVDLVGDFRLTARLSAQSVAARHPVYLTLTLTGVGFPPAKHPLSFHPEGVEVFADKPDVSVRYGKEGARYRGHWGYALVGERDFVVPGVTLRAFSTKNGKLYTLEVPPRRVEVTPPPPLARQVDRANAPESLWDEVAAWKAFGIDVMIFLCGYLTALLAGRLKGVLKGHTVRNRFAVAVKDAGDAKALLELLIREDAARYGVFIDRLERAVYRGEKVDLKRIRKEILAHG